MDKLKIFLAAAKKHQFWVCCGVMLLTSLGCWWWASGDVAKQFESRKVDIDADFSGASVQPGRSQPGRHRQDQAARRRSEAESLSRWETLYAEQKKNSSFPTKVLGEEFKKEFDKLQLPKDQLDPKYLEIYQNHIQDYLPTLEQIVNVRHEVIKDDGTVPGGGPAHIRPKQPGMGRGFGPGGGPGRRTMPGGIMPGGIMPGGIMPGGTPIRPGGLGADSDKEYTGIVDWDEGDIAQLQAHFDWGGRRLRRWRWRWRRRILRCTRRCFGSSRRSTKGRPLSPMPPSSGSSPSTSAGTRAGPGMTREKPCLAGPRTARPHWAIIAAWANHRPYRLTHKVSRRFSKAATSTKKGGLFPTIPNPLAIPSSR